jgi:hypothetical protein
LADGRIELLPSDESALKKEFANIHEIAPGWGVRPVETLPRRSGPTVGAGEGRLPLCQIRSNRLSLNRKPPRKPSQ